MLLLVGQGEGIPDHPPLSGPLHAKPASPGSEPGRWTPFKLQEDSELLAAGEFIGMAAVFGSVVNPTPHPTAIQHGAFVETLIEDRERIKILWQHRTDNPIGRPIDHEETMEGRFIGAQIADTERGREAIQLIQFNVVTELSIGFDVREFDLREANDGEIIRHVTTLDLWEVSLVTFAADREAKISAVRVFGDEAVEAARDTRRDQEETCRAADPQHAHGRVEARRGSGTPGGSSFLAEAIMTTPREMASRIVWSPAVRKALQPLGADQIEEVIRHLTEIVEFSRAASELSLLPFLFRDGDLAGTPVRKRLVKSSMLAGLQLALEQSDRVSDGEEMVH